MFLFFDELVKGSFATQLECQDQLRRKDVQTASQADGKKLSTGSVITIKDHLTIDPSCALACHSVLYDDYN